MSLNRKSVLVPLLGLYLCILGAKLFVIGHHGNPTPFWDQWDAEAASLYLPLAGGNLDLAELIAPHNEHRILWTRLLGLLELKLNGGIWDPLFQMVVNAGIHSLAILLLLFGLRKELPEGAFIPLVLFSLILVVPFGWENTLAGFQSQFYFLLLFGVLSIGWLTAALPLSGRWWLGFAAMVASGFSVASGFLVGLAVAAAYFFQMLLADRKADRRKCIGMGLLLAYAAFAHGFTPAVEAHAPLKAAGIHDFSLSILKALAFPFTAVPCLAIFTQLPVLACTWRGVADHRAGRKPGLPWFLWATILWLYLNAAATAYGRGAGGAAPASRYMDTLALLNVVNFAAGLHLVSMFPGRRMKFALAGWSIILLVGGLGIFGHSLCHVIHNEARLRRIQESNVRRFLEDFDRECMEQIPYYSIPYPTATRLIDLLENETIRDFLPTPLRRPVPADPSRQPGFMANGAPVPLEPKVHGPVWGSCGAEGNAWVGSMLREYYPPQRGGFLEISVAGQPFEDGMNFRIQDMEGRPLRHFKPTCRAKTSWRSLYFRNPGRPFQIIAEDNSPHHWFAFAEPKEIGAGTLLARAALRYWFLFAGIGGGMLAWVIMGIFPGNAAPKREADIQAPLAIPRTPISLPRWKAALPALLLFILAFALFSPSLRYGLVDLDDITYVANNTAVLEGLSASSIRQAFSLDNPTATMYMPLLWISFMADVEWLGATPDHPWGFHFTNVLLHAVNSVLLFSLLLAFCKKPWRAFFFAALWAVHPLRVESVAWVTERKDVLSGLFALLSVGAYVWAGRQMSAPGGAPSPARALSLPPTIAALLFFALGLLVKPSLAPIPFVLLLLDFWPLRRFELSWPSARRAAPRLLLEKIFFFLLAGLAAYGTVRGHQVVTGEIAVPISLRLLSVPLAYGFYLLKTFLPLNLTVLYLSFSSWVPPSVLVASAILAGGLLLVPTLIVWRLRDSCPNQLVGWLWFLGMLVPVSGLIPIPSNDVADRFSYLPAMGLSIAFLFLLPSDPGDQRAGRWIRPVLSLAVLTALSFLSLRQLPAWQNTAALYARVLDVFPRHATALKARAIQLIRDTGDFRQADRMISKALSAEPRHWEAHFTKAQCLSELESPAAAQRHLLGIMPPSSLFTSVAWHRDLARYALMLGQHEEAIRHADQALALLPPHDLSQTPILMLALAAAYEQGDLPRALAYAHRFPPYANKTSLELADLLPHYVFQWVGGYRRDAVAYFRRLTDAAADRPDILNNVAWGLATANWSPADPQEVLGLAQRLLALVPDPNPGILDTLAVAQANAGDFLAARQTLESALALFPDERDPQLQLFMDRLATRLALYQHERPYREDAFTRMYMTFFGELSRLRPLELP